MFSSFFFYLLPSLYANELQVTNECMRMILMCVLRQNNFSLVVLHFDSNISNLKNTKGNSTRFIAQACQFAPVLTLNSRTGLGLTAGPEISRQFTYIYISHLCTETPYAPLNLSGYIYTHLQVSDVVLWPSYWLVNSNFLDI